jgi:hypothetical protein
MGPGFWPRPLQGASGFYEQHSGGRLRSQPCDSFTRQTRWKHRLAVLSTRKAQPSLAEKS